MEGVSEGRSGERQRNCFISNDGTERDHAATASLSGGAPLSGRDTRPSTTRGGAMQDKERRGGQRAGAES